jgi:hypothetical protein
MKDINELPFDEALQLYRKMRKAMLENDEQTLITLKAVCPSMFEEANAKQLRLTNLAVNRLLKKNDSITEH